MPRVSRAALIVVASLSTACSGASTLATGAPGSGGTGVQGELLVLAAASLTDAFAVIADDFTAANPGSSVTFNFASSSTLVTQLLNGAPGDVFASANAAQTDTAAEEGLLAGPAIPFIGNELAISVAPGNPLGIAGLEDLADPQLTLVLAAPEVPAGQYAAEALAGAGVTVTPSSLEPDVRATLSRVALGEADAGIVYSSDIVAAGDAVEGVPIPAEQNVPATYPIATLAGATNPAGADAFVDWVLEAGRPVLLGLGFTLPA